MLPLTTRLGANETPEQQLAAEQATQAAIARELGYREMELARWEIILTTAVGVAALFSLGYHGWKSWRRGQRATHQAHAGHATHEPRTTP